MLASLTLLSINYFSNFSTSYSLLSQTSIKNTSKSIGSGQLEFDEFLTLCARFLIEEDAEAMQEELREAFRLYDKEGNGYIKTSDLREILRALDDKLTEDELDEMIAEIDTDGSGTVDFDGKRYLIDFFERNLILVSSLSILNRIHGNDDWRLDSQDWKANLSITTDTAANIKQK